MKVIKVKSTSTNIIDKTSKTYTYWGMCRKCNEFGHLAKECKIIPSNPNQSDKNTQEQTMINTFRIACSNSSIPQIKYHTTISATKPPSLPQQITADVQLSQQTWNQLSNHMNEMVKTNRLLKKAVQGTYKNDKYT